MWAVFNDLNLPSWVAQGARNSGDVPLTIKLDIGASSAYEESAQIIRSLKRRWQDVTLRSMGTQGVALDDLTGIGPHLNNLSISCMRPTTLPPSLPPDDSHPQIHSLRLTHFPIRWNSPALLSGSLQYLALASVDEHPPTLSEIYVILLSCPNLRTVIFRRLFPRNMFLPDPLPTFPSNILLEHLEHLQLDLPLDFVSQLLQKIEASSCRNIILRWGMYPGPRRQDSLAAILHHLAERIAHLSRPMAGHIMLSDSVLYELRAPELDLSLWMEPSDLEEFANVCFKNQPRIPMEAVWKQTHTPQARRLEWTDGAFPFILRWEIRLKESRPDVAGVRNFLQYLSSEDHCAFKHMHRLELPYLADIVDDLVNVFNCWKSRDEERKTVLLKGASEEDIRTLSTLHPEIRIIREARDVFNGVDY